MMRLYKIFFFGGFFLLSGCTTFGQVDYKNIKSFSAVIIDIQGQALNCSYERGYTVHCERLENGKN